MNYTDQQLKDLLLDVPIDLQDYILSQGVHDDLEETMREWGITSDKKENFRTYILLLLLGEMDFTQFSEEVRRDNPTISTEEADQLVSDVDTLILAKARRIVADENKGGEGEDQISRRLPVQSDSVNKEDILKEIESPTPASNLPMVEIPSGPLSIMDAKLSQPLNMPKQQTTVAPTQSIPVKPQIPQAPQGPKYSGIDPYLEPTE